MKVLNILDRKVCVVTKHKATKNLNIVTVAISICNPGDLYIKDYGKKLALERLQQKDGRFVTTVVAKTHIVHQNRFIHAIARALAIPEIHRAQKIIKAWENV